MHCLNDCENAVLDFFMGKGDKTTCLYQCAEDLAEDYEVKLVLESCAVIVALGLIKTAGDTTTYLKLSPAAMGDVATGYFREVGHQSEAVVLLEKRLIELELNTEKNRELSAATAAARKGGPGGLVEPKSKK